MTEKINKAFDSLAAYCENESYRGYDPYDGLNSSLFRSIPVISGKRFFRLAWIQFFKRSPVNLRPIAGIKKDYNPKALGLFLSGFCYLYRNSQEKQYLEKILFFTSKLLDLQSRSWSGTCWGYNFDWQARAFFQPAHTPTVVATTFIGCAFLDAYEITKDTRLLEAARSSCDFILKDLNRTYGTNGNFAFSYSPLDKSVVYNASLLGSRLLARVYSITNEAHLLEAAESSVRFCCENQRENGSWSYGSQHFHQWVDNFHTGYNLECLSDFMRYTGKLTYTKNFEKGLDFYLKTFFTREGIPRYYENSLYPIDIHSSAQLVVTICKTAYFRKNMSIASKVLNWTIDNMRSEKGYFFYQKNRYFSSRIPYMRWAQAWMFYALSMYLFQTGKEFNPEI